jgi:DNA polymerase-3 subunit gamma/tau
MENFIVSARKYRPATFDQVVGQKSITSTLKNAIKNNQLAQAFLFTGPRGVGKTTCARIFAQTINCENLSENTEPCNECESCTSFKKSNSFNIHELDAASNNSVEDIRKLVDQVRIPPQVGKYKVYIIDEVHMLSQAAFNAFLKTLEEPPEYAKFILATTEKHKIIPTILSRCQIYDFNRITIKDIIQHLKYVANKENVKFEDAAIHTIAQKADGALRDALSIFDQLVSFSNNGITYQETIDNLNVLDLEYYFAMVDMFLEGDIYKTLTTLNKIISNGFDSHHFINGLASHLRNLLVSTDLSTIDLLEISEDFKGKYILQSKKCSLKFLISALDICNKVDLNYKAASNKYLLVEHALIKICGIENEFSSEVKQPKIIKPAESPKAKSAPTIEKVEKPIEQKQESTVENKQSKIASEKAEQPKAEKPISEELKVEKPKVDKSESELENVEKPEKPEEESTEKAEEKAPDISEKPKIETKESDKQIEIEAAADEKKSDSEPISSKYGVKIDKSKSNKVKKGKRLQNRTYSISEELEKTGMKDEIKEEEIDEEQILEKPDKLINKEDLGKAIDSYKALISAKRPSFAAALDKDNFSLEDNNRIVFKFHNSTLNNPNFKYHFLKYLKKELNNDQITLDAQLAQEEKERRKSDYEKFDEISKENPSVKKLKDQLNLDFD